MSQVALRRQRGVVAYQQGQAAEPQAEQALERDGWGNVARRRRNPRGPMRCNPSSRHGCWQPVKSRWPTIPSGARRASASTSSSSTTPAPSAAFRMLSGRNARAC